MRYNDIKLESILSWIWGSNILLITIRDKECGTYNCILFPYPQIGKNSPSKSQATSVYQFHSNLQMHRHIIGLTSICATNHDTNDTEIIMRFSE